MLRAFEGLTLSRLKVNGHVQVYLTPLSAVQQRLLEVLGLPATIYERLTHHCSEPLLNLSEHEYQDRSSSRMTERDGESGQPHYFLPI